MEDRRFVQTQIKQSSLVVDWMVLDDPTSRTHCICLKQCKTNETVSMKLCL